MKKTVLVTGAAGFIGSHLCEALLEAGYRVVGIDNFDAFYSRIEKENNLQVCRQSPDFFFVEGDAGNKNILQNLPVKIDVIAHLAAKAGVLPSLKDPQAYIQTNIQLTSVLLEWMREQQINKIVFASSSSVYGNNKKIPFEEEDPVNMPISPYAFSKRSCELMNYTYHSLYGFDIINLRFFTVYGERQRPDLAIRKFVSYIFAGKPITVYGDGKTARDYTYYSDTVKGVLAAIDYVISHKNVWEIINLGNNNPVFLIDLVHAIGKAANRAPTFIYEEMKPGDVNITYADIEKAKRILNYKPEVNLEAGLSNFIRWFQKTCINEVRQ